MVIHVDNNGVQHNIKEIRRKSKILPDGLELYEYLESTGTQWINTGYIPTFNTVTKTKINAVSNIETAAFQFGSRISFSSQAYYMYYQSPYWYYACNSSSNVATTVTSRLAEIEYSISSIKLNGQTISTGQSTFTGSKPIYLFRVNTNGTADSQRGVTQIFYFKLYESGVLVMNLIPCTYYEKPGMWDTVNNKFYGNHGTGQFILGNKIALEEYEYLQSTGTQYINTGIPYDSTKSTYKIECKFSQPSNVGQYDAIFGAYTGESYKCLRIIRGNSNSVMWTYYNNQANSGNKVAFSTSNTNIREIVITSSSTILTENETTTTYENKAVNGTNTTSTFYLFCQGIANDSPICLSKSIIYYFRLYDNDTLIKDFVPVSYNRTPGMWDKVEMKFYPNAGTGTFTLGPKKYDYNYNKIHQIRKTKRLLPNGVELYEYIESTGTQWIDTGVICNSGISTYLDFQCTTSHSSYSEIMGYATSTSWTPYGFGTNTGTNGAFTKWGNGTITMSSVSFTTNRVNVTFLSNSTNNNGSIAIFTIGGNSGDYVNQHMKVFQCKITDSNNNLVRNMIPCTYYGEPGMWDTVENKFYSNAGTGNFILGPKLNLKQYEYLESTGTQWIDTGVVINNYFKIQSKFQFVSTAGYQILYGMMPSSSTITPRISFWRYSNKWLSGINNSIQFGTYSSQVHTLEHTYNQQDGENIIIDGTNYVIQTSPPSISSNTLSLGLFTRHQNDTCSYPASAKIYFYKIYGSNGTALLRNYVPCTCNEVPGLWDKVEWKFYGNSGTGQFNIGNMNYYGIINLDITDDYYNNKYFTITALKNGSITFTYGSTVSTTLAEYLEYSSNNGQTWTRITNVDNSSVSETINVTKGQRVIWRGINSAFTIAGKESGSCFSCTEVDVSGNIMSLLYGDNFKQQTTLTNEYTFAQLFNFCEIYNAKDLVLPATTITNYCYMCMFDTCEHLITPPKILPALTVQEECYSGMFYDCSNLKVTPQLPATSLARRCYYQMFRGCTSLTVVTDLLAKTLGTRSYEQMFYGCSSLVNAQSSLPAMSLGTYCYQAMFHDCSSLVNVPTLPAINIANGAYGAMFQNCTSLITAPELPALTLRLSCYASMFKGCSKLNYVKCLATSISASSCTNNWLDGVASTGTFVKNSSMSGWTTGVSGIPSGWTIQNA